MHTASLIHGKGVQKICALFLKLLIVFALFFSFLNAQQYFFRVHFFMQNFRKKNSKLKQSITLIRIKSSNKTIWKMKWKIKHVFLGYFFSYFVYNNFSAVFICIFWVFPVPVPYISQNNHIYLNEIGFTRCIPFQ